MTTGRINQVAIFPKIMAPTQATQPERKSQKLTLLKPGQTLEHTDGTTRGRIENRKNYQETNQRQDPAEPNPTVVVTDTESNPIKVSDDRRESTTLAAHISQHASEPQPSATNTDRAVPRSRPVPNEKKRNPPQTTNTATTDDQ